MGIAMMRQQQHTKSRSAVLVLVGILALAGEAQAHDSARDHHAAAGGHRAFAHERHAFHERDVHRFGRLELAHWRAGRWNHQCYAGRCGWWWFADGQWFFYDRPVYPYPPYVAGRSLIAPLPVLPVVPARAYAPVPVPVPAPNPYY